jgi:hypothetical protein
MYREFVIIKSELLIVDLTIQMKTIADEGLFLGPSSVVTALSGPRSVSGGMNI